MAKSSKSSSKALIPYEIVNGEWVYLLGGKLVNWEGKPVNQVSELPSQVSKPGASLADRWGF